jgi:DNA-binding NarL/FixJ family response regulator
MMEVKQGVSAKKSFLLIGSSTSRWPTVLEKALLPLGTLITAKEEEAVGKVVSDCYDIAIIDARCVTDVRQMISRLRARRPETRVVVATLSTDWREAREVLRAGASDYILQAEDEKKLRSKIKEILDRPPPRRSS